MQQMPGINLNISRPKKINSWLVILFLLPLFAQAQQRDTTRVLSIDLDTTPVIEAPVQDLTTDDEDEGEEIKEEKKEPGVFLPTWSVEQDSIEIRHLDAAARKAQQEDDAFWYANKTFKKDKKPEERSGRVPLIMHPAFQTILWIVVIAGFITFIIIFLSNGNVGIFRKSKYIKDIDPGEADLDDIFAINYQQELAKALSSENYRLAVRLLYLQLLRKLADRNIIDYKQDRTNFDYLMQLQPTRYYNDFFRLTRHYEYSWYGQFSLEREKFDIIRQAFENFDRKLI
jgi:hypothetical protein